MSIVAFGQGWVTNLPDWQLPEDLAKENFFLTQGKDTTAHLVEEVAIEGRIFVRDLPLYIQACGLKPVSTGQAFVYANAGGRGQWSHFSHKMIIAGEGGVSPEGKVLSLTCSKVVICTPDEVLGADVRLLVLRSSKTTLIIED